MKKIKFTFCFTILLSLLACTTDIEDAITDSNSDQNQPTVVTQNISQDEALEISQKVLKRASKTRGHSTTNPKFEFVLNDAKTRACGLTLPDTLAYIINYPNDNGFVIVSSVRRVYPVLAFSDKGHFSFNNEIAKYNFIDNIGSYIGNADSSATYYVDDMDFDGCYTVQPAVKTCLSQGNPWDKYVIKEHPGCPVGCVAVATALVLSYSTPELTYHGSKFYFKSIMEAINREPDEDADENYADISKLYNDWDNIDQPTYTYEQATDSMAKLLYFIGKDLNISYNPDGSSAYSIDAYNLCEKITGKIESGFASFNINEIVCCLKNNCIVYVRGRDYNKKEGHAWISDGCYFCTKNGIYSGSNNMTYPGTNSDTNILTKEDIIDGTAYIHCDWGWGGNCNGYYSGEVFKAGSSNFTPTSYFAVKRTKK